MGVPVSGKGRPEKQRIGGGTAPMEEQRGMEMPEEAGAGPRRGLGRQQGDGPAVRRLPGMAPQGFQAQKEHQPLPVFMEDPEKAVEKLIGDAGLFLRAQDGSAGLQAHGNKGEEGLDGIRKERDHVHGQDGMGLSAGGAFQPQDIHLHVLRPAVFRIPQHQAPFISGMAAHGAVPCTACRVRALIIPCPIKR